METKRLFDNDDQSTCFIICIMLMIIELIIIERNKRLCVVLKFDFSLVEPKRGEVFFDCLFV